MGFVDHHERGAGAGEALSTAICLDVVEGNYSERVGVEDCFRCLQRALEASSGRGGHGDRVDLGLITKLPCPLFDEMWGAKNGEAINLTAVEQLTEDEACLYRFTDAN